MCLKMIQVYLNIRFWIKKEENAEELMIEVLEPILNYIKKDPDKNWLIVEKSIKRIRLVYF